MTDKIEKSFCEEIKSSKHFLIFADSTPDVSHVHQHQLTFILRYANCDGEIVEQFFGFVPLNFIMQNILKMSFCKRFQLV